MTCKKAIGLLKKPFFDVTVSVALALFILVFHANSNGESDFFGFPFHDYIEETSTFTPVKAQSLAQTTDFNSFLTANTSIIAGKGGQDNSIDPTLIQENSVAAYNPTAENYIETLGMQQNQITEYTVQPGDLISFIASDYGVSVNSIIWSNDLKNPDSLQIGQILKIPPVSGIIHKVKKGETLAILATKYGVTEDKILAFNDLPQSGRLDIDDELVIPDAQVQIARSAVNQNTASVNTIKRFSYLPNLGDFFMVPTTGFNWGKIHGRNGVDIANACGTPIYAAADGTVETADGAGWNGGFGNYIKLVHLNGTETLYAHAKKLSVTAGQVVSRGILIAYMGTTGRSTGCHLHFEVHGAKNPLVKP